MEDGSCYDLSLLRVLRPGETPPPVICTPSPGPSSSAVGQLQTTTPAGRYAWPYNDPVPGGPAPTLQEHSVAPAQEIATPVPFEPNHGPLFRVEADNVAPAQRPANERVYPLQYFLIGVLFAGLFVAAALVVIDAPSGLLSSYDLQSEQEQRAARAPLLPRYDIQDVADENVFVVVSRNEDAAQHVVQDAPAEGALTRSGDPSFTGAAASEEAPQYAGASPPMASERRVDQQCSRYYYTYCSRPANLFHFDPEQRACIPAAENRAQLCNRGANRFGSLDQCRQSCLEPGRVSEKCFENTLFEPCLKQDMTAAFWYFNGTTCKSWSFPHGNCPSMPYGVYGTFEECSHRCNDTSPKGNMVHCAVPEARPCTLSQLRFPYFALMQAGGRARCVNASRERMHSRRCLVGGNQFHSLRSCQKVCLY